MSELVDHFDEYVRALAEERALPDSLSERDLQVAITLLLVQVLRADLEIKEEEAEAVVLAAEEVLGLDHEDGVF